VTVIVSLLALGFLMLVAYRGYSVILFAPVAALGAVLLTMPGAVLPAYSALFMENMATFVRNYFPVFMLGALFGKMIEISGFAKALAAGITRVAGPHRAMLGIVIICALMVYGGVSVFVVCFAVYPFAAELFREAAIPKRLIPGTMSLGTFTFAMDALPGSPQIQNIIPTTFFGTTTMAAPILGPLGGLFIFGVGMAYLEWRRRAAAVAGETYGTGHLNEPEHVDPHALVSPFLAFTPLAVVAAANIILTEMIPRWYGATATLALTPAAKPLAQLLAAFGARVVGYDPALHASDTLWSRWQVQPLGLRELFEACDGVCVLLTYFSRYRGLLGERFLSLSKSNQVLVCLAHSSLFDERALADALSGGRLAAAWFDSMEPGMLDPGRPLRHLDTLQVTPHVASTTLESRSRSAWAVARRIDELLGAAPPEGGDVKPTAADDLADLEDDSAPA